MTSERVILILVILSVPAVNLYPVFYAFRPWRSTPQGRALMLKALGNVILIDMATLYAWFGDYALRNEVRIVGFSLFLCGINYLFWTLITSQGAEHYPPRSWFRRRKHQCPD